MPVPTPPHAIIEAGDGRIRDAHSVIHGDGEATVDIAGDDDPSALMAASGDIVEADTGTETRDDDLRYGRSFPAQQAAAAQSAAQTTATTTAEPDARDDATLAAPRRIDDPQPADDPVTPDKADEPLNPYLTDDKTDPPADDGTSGDAPASE